MTQFFIHSLQMLSQFLGDSMSVFKNKKWNVLDWVSGFVLGILIFLTVSIAPVVNTAALQSGHVLSATNESP